MAPKMGKPTMHVKVLSEKKRVKAPQQAIFVNNATSSPLLAKLPGEIRTRIFRYALGGNTLHIEDRVRAVVCSASLSLRSSAESIIAEGREIGQSCMDDHGDCTSRFRALDGPTPTYYSVALLLACRQIHKEVALLLFNSNTFVFDNGRPFERFVNRLVQEQRKAVTSISICTGASIARLALLPSKPFFARLSDLKHITILAHATTSDYPDSSVPGAPMYHISTALTAASRYLQYTNWASVVVAITSEGTSAHRAPLLTAADLRQEARKLEQTLLKSYVISEEERAERKRKLEQSKVRRAEREKKRTEERDQKNASRGERGLRATTVVSYGR